MLFNNNLDKNEGEKEKPVEIEEVKSLNAH